MGIRSITVLLLVGVTLMASLACGGGDDAQTPTAAAAAETPSGPHWERFPYQGREHIPPGQPHAEYNSVPATSGWHYSQPYGPAPWGIYDTPLPDEVLVHNLEHGGIGIHYDCPEGCLDLVALLAALAVEELNSGKKIVLSPYPGMDTTIALTAWNYLDGFQELDEARVSDFIRAHESSPNAPEAFVR